MQGARHDARMAHQAAFLCPPRYMACVGCLVIHSRRGEHPLAQVPSISVTTVNSIRLACRRDSGDASPLGDIFKLIWWAVIGLFRSRVSLQAEILTLRHQLTVLRRKSPKRLAFSNCDRLVFAGLYRIAPRVVNDLMIVESETVIRWHRTGFRSFWRWKSRCRGGRPKVPLEFRQLIRGRCHVGDFYLSIEPVAADRLLRNPQWSMCVCVLTL
jgi:hypothetical protein